MTEHLANPLINTPEFQSLLAEYKATLTKYQPSTRYYFGLINQGVRIDFKTGKIELLTLDDMRERIRLVSPVGPPTTPDQIEEVTIKDYFKEIDKILEDETIFYYAKEKEEFSVWEGLQIAGKLGYTKIFFDNLS